MDTKKLKESIMNIKCDGGNSMDKLAKENNLKTADDFEKFYQKLMIIEEDASQNDDLSADIDKKFNEKVDNLKNKIDELDETTFTENEIANLNKTKIFVQAKIMDTVTQQLDDTYQCLKDIKENRNVEEATKKLNEIKREMNPTFAKNIK